MTRGALVTPPTGAAIYAGSFFAASPRLRSISHGLAHQLLAEATRSIPNNVSIYEPAARPMSNPTERKLR